MELTTRPKITEWMLAAEVNQSHVDTRKRALVSSQVALTDRGMGNVLNLKDETAIPGTTITKHL